MRLPCCLTLTLFFVVHRAYAAVVQGVILDEETGNALARAKVSLVPLPGTPATEAAVRSGRRGSFAVLNVTPGWYVVRATRRGYAPAESGQLRAGRPGHAFEIADSREAGFIEIRMGRLPAITGSVLDENSIGIPKWPVHIYTASKPVRRIGQTFTDDRGNFRIGELDPGRYLVRSGPGPWDDQTALMATYAEAKVELAGAQSVTLRVGETARDVIIRPIKGNGFTLSGNFLPLAGPATLTLITDTGRSIVMSGSDNKVFPFSTSGVQPGPVEFIVAGFDGFGNTCGSYTPLVVDKDLFMLRLACNPIGKSSVQMNGTPKSPPLVRRVDLDGVGPSHALVRDELFVPGHWEISVPRGDYYVASVRNDGPPAPNVLGWFGFNASYYTRLVVTLGMNASSMVGVVSTKGSPVTGAPIFVTNTASGETWNTRSDPQGNYSIRGLAPGDYTIISGFDLDLENSGAMQKADTVRVPAGGPATHDLELVLP